jgi:transaldolase / glucose-6-phosphate isomerase
MVPAALLGLDMTKVFSNAALMVNSCRSSNPPQQNPGVMLGIILGEAARAGRDKLTLLASPTIAPFGAWVEQLVAESTGKHGHGIVPVDAEPIGSLASYGNDRLFVYLRLEGQLASAQEALTQALIQAGHPVVTITLSSLDQLMQEFFRWEIATAVAGAVLGIHPFDQPDVEAAKVQARALLDTYERERELPQQKPLLQDDGLRFYTALSTRATKSSDLMREFLVTLGEGDYFAILAYLPMLEQHQKTLQKIRQQVRDAKHVATCLGFGPRFLHSTGQLYKGGPNSGVFLVLTCDDAKDIAVPDSVASFGVVKSAQASGDVAVLEARGRRVLRVHLEADISKGLAALMQMIKAAIE